MRRSVDVPKIKRLDRGAHKGDRGRVLIVAGSLRMSGAARLAGWGALRGGAGLVTIATPDVIQPLVAAELPCAMTLPLPTRRRGALSAAGAMQAREFAATADAVAIGPGLTPDVAPFLRRFLRGMQTPLVLDADALNVLAGEPDLLDGVEAARVLTPHPGEAERLLDEPVGTEPAKRLAAAVAIADRYHAVAVLKGAGTVVTDGDRHYRCRLGNPGMATGGTGDVLAGLIAARLASGTGPFSSALQSVHIHARAGDLAAAAVGEHGMIATDLVANLSAAVAELVEPAPRRHDKKGQPERRRPGGRRAR